MEDILVPIAVCALLFVGAPWVVLHFITQWKKTGSLTVEDERLLDELHDLARRLDERMGTVERIVAADHPGFRPGLRLEPGASDLRHASHDADPGRAERPFDPQRGR